ncbi:MAG TPA: NUDIX hydrolase [Anaerolineales bacterium]|jgi:8-oxo-dGTP pyrophosphatase MutT (NUDIX family)|nr:NUDIX hydrolase [Anaerolineales bacterium]
MPKQQDNPSSSQGKVTTMDQVSAGGVAFHWRESEPEIAIVSVKPKLRWQLPKGIVDPGETPQVTAVREVREEAGIETDLIRLIETIEYWYRSVKYGKPVRYHKFVHFYLLEYKSGDVTNHDHEVEESRWVSFDEALEMLDFKSERDVVEKAREMIAGLEKRR